MECRIPSAQLLILCLSAVRRLSSTRVGGPPPLAILCQLNARPFTRVVLRYSIRIVVHHHQPDQGLLLCGVQGSWRGNQRLRLGRERRVLRRHAIQLLVQDHHPGGQLKLKSTQPARFSRQHSSRSKTRCGVHGRGRTGKLYSFGLLSSLPASTSPKSSQERFSPRHSSPYLLPYLPSISSYLLFPRRPVPPVTTSLRPSGTL